MRFDIKAKYDVIVLGSGISGLICALELASNNKSVCIITKEAITESSSLYAQGGIAVPLNENDSTQKHLDDTIKAGCGFINPKVAEKIISYSKIALEKLISYGVNFDIESSFIHQTREGAHSVPRVCHVGGDATGRYVTKVLIDKVCRNPKIAISQGTIALSILKHDEGSLCGVLLEDVTREKYVLLSDDLIIATGGAGQLYKETTNPKVCTGDGMAMAYRAGACLRDIEFVQFHPTVLLEGDVPVLITEAIRGEGGTLKNINGEFFAKKYHDMGELAPRDVLSRAILSEMHITGAKYVYLDLSNFNEDYFINRFPTVYKSCIERKIKLFKEGIPVTPAAHYFIGGTLCNLYGKTNLDNLWVVGESASCGFHGSNRLASNSLLECIVVPHFLVDKLLKQNKKEFSKSNFIYVDIDISEFTEDKIKNITYEMQCRNTQNLGLIRSETNLKEHLNWLKNKIYEFNVNLPSVYYQVQEVKNMILLSYLICYSALERNHSIGVHFREDFKDSPNELKHSIFSLKYGFNWDYVKPKEQKLVSIS